MLKLLSSFSKFSVSKKVLTSNVHTSSILNFKFTPVLCAEPLKKKKKIDPAIVKAREERRRKKLEKQIRRLEKVARQFKPIEELETPLTLLDEKQIRSRNLPPVAEAEQERRESLLKKWSQYKMEENMKDIKILDQLMMAQEKALNELRFESEELYQHAIMPDIDMVPYVVKGPVHTPAIKDYQFIDGDYVNTTRIYDGETLENE